MTETRQHTRFSPSASERVIGCPGSTNLLARTPVRPDGIYAREGNVAHEILEIALTNGLSDAETAHREHSTHFFEELDENYTNFYGAIDEALEYVYGIMDLYPDAVMHIEVRVNPPLPAAPGEAAGYCDIMIHSPAAKILYVIDYKHGAGVYKSAEGNTQIMQYGAGALYDEHPKVSKADVDQVVLVIVQPRAISAGSTIREHRVTPADLTSYLVVLNNAVIEHLKPNSPLMPGDTWCQFCDANTTCPAREAKALQAVGATFNQLKAVSLSEFLPAPEGMDMDRLGHIRLWGPLLKKWLSDVEKHCYQMARDGHHIPGAKLVTASPKRKYFHGDTETAKRISVLADIPIDDLYKKTLLPLTKTEPMVRKAFASRAGKGGKKRAGEAGGKAFALLTLKQSSEAIVLVDEADPRTALNTVKNTFNQIGGILPPPSIKKV